MVELPVKLADSSQQIANSCTNKDGSSFIATGRGGIPQNPEKQVDINSTWSDIRNLSVYREGKVDNSDNTTAFKQSDVVEATAVIRNENGEIQLIAAANESSKTGRFVNCSG